jgi:chemotaxis protein CheC
MLSESQLAALTELFRHGSDEASAALSRWLDRPARISIEAVEQLPLTEATNELGDPERPVCCCAMRLSGPIAGQLLLIVDDASGLALADLLLGQRIGTATSWGELERSASLETANIIGCAYLNALTRCLPVPAERPAELLPSPPQFARDYAESVLQFALMDQAMTSDVVFLTRTAFAIQDAPVSCNLLFVPSADCLTVLRSLLPG